MDLILNDSPKSGIILIDKNENETSFDVVKKIKKITGQKKVGHAGTLDPFATGLLILLIGQGTKLSPYIMSGTKKYRATLRLGVETDTMDPTGRVVGSHHVPAFDPDYIQEATRCFIGDIEQIPPAFSAVKYEGKRAYELARKGVRVELNKRTVTIHTLDIIKDESPFLTIEVCCSGGTYIRSLASDIGKRLGTGAHLKALRRLSSGSFRVNDALDSTDIGSSLNETPLEDKMISLRDALPDMVELQVKDGTAEKIRKGARPTRQDMDPVSGLSVDYEGYIKLVNGMDLIAVMKVNHLPGKSTDWIETLRVFH